MEFEPAFRWIDVADELAFLCSDLDARGFPAHEHAFLGGYLDASGDFEALRLIGLYKAHRALIRAKVTALGVEPESASTERERAACHCRAYIRSARAALSPHHPRLILMSGLSGSGKTWLASRLAPRLGAIHVRSDVERKRGAGIEPSRRSGAAPEQGLYAASKTAQVYETLLAAAGHALAGGYTVIVDATFNRRADRELFRELAGRRGVPLQLLRCEAPESVLRHRIGERAAQARDASDADLDVLQWQQQHAEAIDPGEALEVIEVRTADPFEPSIGELVRRLGPARNQS
jgi:predicted kinase